mmetsp:Transcript_5197/g.7181  ORF Transcript_5197/g.7181 Transcript_5197/m.7181 type:complete len:216 (-) Transcript_5197:1059-1706(-)
MNSQYRAVRTMVVSKNYCSRLFMTNYEKNSDTNIDANREDNDESNSLVKTMKVLYDKLFFYGLDKSFHINKKDRNKLKKMANEIHKNEKINPFLTRSEQLAEAFIRVKSNAFKKRNDNAVFNTINVEANIDNIGNNDSITSLQSLNTQMEDCRNFLEYLENDLKVLEITEKSLDDNDIEDRITIEEQKQQLNQEINNLKVEMITLQASIDDLKLI